MNKSRVIAVACCALVGSLITLSSDMSWWPAALIGAGIGWIISDPDTSDLG